VAKIGLRLRAGFVPRTPEILKTALRTSGIPKRMQQRSRIRMKRD